MIEIRPLISYLILLMGKPKPQKDKTTEGDPLPFYIVRDYRKSLKLKKQRELRKRKIIQEKELIKDAKREEKSCLIQQINRSMFEEDHVWNQLQEDLFEDTPEVQESTGQEGGFQRKVQKLRWEVLFTLGNVQKEALFSHDFLGFDYRC